MGLEIMSRRTADRNLHLVERGRLWHPLGNGEWAVRVGEDEQGNIYYQTMIIQGRWVIYKGVADASKISATWHGWMHHRTDEPPTSEHLPAARSAEAAPAQHDRHRGRLSSQGIACLGRGPSGGDRRLRRGTPGP